MNNHNPLSNITLQILSNIESSGFKLKERKDSIIEGNVLVFTNGFETIEILHKDDEVVEYDVLYVDYYNEDRTVNINIEFNPTEYSIRYYKDTGIDKINLSMSIEKKIENKDKYIQNYNDLYNNLFNEVKENKFLYDLYDILKKYCCIKLNYLIMGKLKEKYEKMLKGIKI